jgi:hypothetical protein
MANDKTTPVDDEADFSSYLKEKPPIIVPRSQPKPSPLQALPSNRKLSKRVYYLIILLLALAVAQAAMLFLWTRDSAPPIPNGYKLVAPPNQPAHIEPIK